MKKRKKPSKRQQELERRRQQRFPLSMNVDLTLPDGTHRAKTRAVSANGFYIDDVPSSGEAGSSVGVALWLPVGYGGEETAVRGQGRVVRLARGSSKDAGAAVRFDRIQFARAQPKEEKEKEKEKV
ncbi:MAG: PilZ domain-containing protein [Terriglobia bacterium]